MKSGLNRKTSGITFNQIEIEKAVTVNKSTSKFWRISPYGNGVNSFSTNSPIKAIKNLSRNDIKITGSVLRQTNTHI